MPSTFRDGSASTGAVITSAYLSTGIVINVTQTGSKTETDLFVYVRQWYQQQMVLCTSASLAGLTWFRINLQVFDNQKVVNVVITPQNGLFLLENGTLAYCGAYIVPNFGDVEESVRQFPL